MHCLATVNECDQPTNNMVCCSMQMRCIKFTILRVSVAVICFSLSVIVFVSCVLLCFENLLYMVSYCLRNPIIGENSFRQSQKMFLFATY